MAKILTLVGLILSCGFRAEARFSCVDMMTRLFGPSRTVQVSQQIRDYKMAIKEITRINPKEVNLGFQSEWSADHACTVYSGQLDVMLKAKSFNTVRIMAQSSSGEAGLHAYLADLTNPEAKIIIDPTFRFFLPGAPIPESAIFVGTREDLIRLFTKYRKFIRPSTIDDIGKEIDPTSAVDSFYGLTDEP